MKTPWCTATNAVSASAAWCFPPPQQLTMYTMSSRETLQNPRDARSCDTADFPAMWCCANVQCSAAVHQDAGRETHDPYAITVFAAAFVAPGANIAGPCVDAPDWQSPLPPMSSDSEVSPAISGPASRVWVALPVPVSPILSHRAASARTMPLKIPANKAVLQDGRVTTAAGGTECVQCGSMDSFAHGTCQLCGFESVQTAKAAEPVRFTPSVKEPQQLHLEHGLQPTERSFVPRSEIPASATQLGAHVETCPATCAVLLKNSDAAPEVTRSQHVQEPVFAITRCGVGFRLCHSSLGKLSVDTMLPGGAAEEDGTLLSGDQILSINGNSTADLIDADEVARALVGEEGSSVSLLVWRPATQGLPFELNLERKLFDDQFDSIHSGPTPRPGAAARLQIPSRALQQAEPHVQDAMASAPSDERPRSMPITGFEKALGRDVNRAPDALPGSSKPTSPASSETPAVLLQHRLDRAIRRTSPPLLTSGPPTVPGRSETPIDVLLAKYTTNSPLALRVITPTAPLSTLPAPETQPTRIQPADESQPLVCQRCQRLYLEVETDTQIKAHVNINCCAGCSEILSGPENTHEDTESSFPQTAGQEDRRSWGLAKILGTEEGTAAHAALSRETSESEKGAHCQVYPSLEPEERISSRDRSAESSPRGDAHMNPPTPTPTPPVAAGVQSGARDAADGKYDAFGALPQHLLGDQVQTLSTIRDDDQQHDEEACTYCPQARPLTAPAMLRNAAPMLDCSAHPDGTAGVTTEVVSGGPILAADVAVPQSALSGATEHMPHDSESRVLRKGWMTKEATSGLKSIFIKSRKRWCVLRRGYLQYFHSETEDGRSEVISLGSMESVSIETKKNSPFLVIKTPQRTYMFSRPDKTSTTTVFEWLQDITRAILDAPVSRSSAASVSSSAPLPSAHVESRQAHSQPEAQTTKQPARTPTVGTVFAFPAPELPGASDVAGEMMPLAMQDASIPALYGASMPSMQAPQPERMSYSAYAVPEPPQTWPYGHSEVGLMGNAMPPMHMAPPPASSIQPMMPLHTILSGHLPYAMPQMHNHMVQQEHMHLFHQHQQQQEEDAITPVSQEAESYELYSSMYEHDALATRTGILISADVSPSMAAIKEPLKPPPMQE